ERGGGRGRGRLALSGPPGPRLGRRARGDQPGGGDGKPALQPRIRRRRQRSCPPRRPPPPPTRDLSNASGRPRGPLLGRAGASGHPPAVRERTTRRRPERPCPREGRVTGQGRRLLDDGPRLRRVLVPAD